MSFEPAPSTSSRKRLASIPRGLPPSNHDRAAPKMCRRKCLNFTFAMGKEEGERISVFRQDGAAVFNLLQTPQGDPGYQLLDVDYPDSQTFQAVRPT